MQAGSWAWLVVSAAALLVGVNAECGAPVGHTGVVAQRLHCPPDSFNSAGARAATAGKATAAARGIVALRGGGESLVYDPARSAGLGIGLTKDKLGNHVVKKLAKGWPAEQSGLIEEKDIILEVDGQAVFNLDTQALLQALRGPEGSEVELLLQRGTEGTLVSVMLSRNPVVPVGKEASTGSTAAVSNLIGATVASAQATAGSIGETVMGLVSRKEGKSSPKNTAPVGVGMGFTLNSHDMYEVTKLVPGGAAERSGELRVGDLILRVDGVDTEGLTSKEVIAHVRGPPGSQVTLDVLRGSEEAIQVVLVRGDAGDSNPAKKPVSKGGSGSGSGAASSPSIFSTFSKLGGTDALAKLSASASGATASLGSGLGSGLSSLTSLVGSLPSMGSKKTAAAAPITAPGPDAVGIGLGIKKNQHGDFMVTDVTAGGVAAASGKIQVGDVVVAVGRTGVSGLKSAMLRDLIMGSPGTACDLVLSRWVVGDDGGEGQWQSIEVTLVRRKSKKKKAAAAAK